MITQIKHHTLAERAPSTLFTRHDEPTVVKIQKSVPIYRVGRRLHKIFRNRLKNPQKNFQPTLVNFRGV